MNIIGRVSETTGWIVSSLYLIVFVVTILDVGLRYFLNAPTIWGLELVIALAGIHYVIGGAQALKHDAHVKIDLIYRLLPQNVRKVMDVLAFLLSAVFLLVIAYYGTQQAWTSWLRGETSGAGWNSNAPMVMKIAIPIGAVLMILQLIASFIEKLKGNREF